MRSVKKTEGRFAVKIERSVINTETNLDGHVFNRPGEVRDVITVSAMGHEFPYREPRPVDEAFVSEEKKEVAKKKGATHFMGSIALRPESLAAITKAYEKALEAINAVETMEEKEAREDMEAREALAEKNIRDNARIDEQRRANGFCAKCGSYCYRDCDA